MPKLLTTANSGEMLVKQSWKHTKWRALKPTPWAREPRTTRNVKRTVALAGMLLAVHEDANEEGVEADGGGDGAHRSVEVDECSRARGSWAHGPQALEPEDDLLAVLHPIYMVHFGELAILHEYAPPLPFSHRY